MKEDQQQELNEQSTLTIEQLRQKEELTEEEFLLLVLKEKEEALAKERELRLKGTPPKKRLPKLARIAVWFMSAALIISMFAAVVGSFNIPAIEFLKTSAKLYANEDVRQYKEAIVEVRTPSGKGTGFAISEDGYIITNEHVIDNETNITISFPEAGIFAAEVIKADETVDTALLKINSDEMVPFLPLSLEEFVQQNEHILFIGNPLSYSFIANEGVAIDEVILKNWSEPVWMLDAPIYKGNSGSPVLNEAGQVVGIIFATTRTEQYGKVGLFISIETFYNYFQDELEKIQ